MERREGRGSPFPRSIPPLSSLFSLLSSHHSLLSSHHSLISLISPLTTLSSLFYPLSCNQIRKYAQILFEGQLLTLSSWTLPHSFKEGNQTIRSNIKSVTEQERQNSSPSHLFEPYMRGPLRQTNKCEERETRG